MPRRLLRYADLQAAHKNQSPACSAISLAPMGHFRASNPKLWSCCHIVFVLKALTDKLVGATSDSAALVLICIRFSPPVLCGNIEKGAQQILINYKTYSNLIPHSGKGRELFFWIYSQVDQIISSSSIQDCFPTTEVDPAGILLVQQNSNYFHLTPTDRTVIPSQNKGQESSSSHIIYFQQLIRIRVAGDFNSEGEI